MHTSDHLLSAYLARYVRAIAKRKSIFAGHLVQSRRQARAGALERRAERSPN